MNTDSPRVTMAKAFRETTLSLIGLFQIYDVDPEMNEAAAEVLGQVFRRHIQGAPVEVGDECLSPLHTLVDELERVAKLTRRTRRRR
jgi:hypothetical protein